MGDELTANLAVVLGISDYEPAVGRLQTPVRDAEAIARLLERRFGYEVILRCDGEATLEKLRTLLREELPRRVPEDSRLLVYFAGHGVALDSAELEGPRGSLVPHGGGAGVETHLAMDELYQALTGLSCRHLLVVLDCCFGGSFRWAGRRPLHTPGELLYEERYRHWVRHPAHWFLASAAHDEYALDSLDRRRGRTGGHSPFAAAVLDGLEGKADLLPAGGDGVVTLAELYAYVQDRLSPHQSPLLSPLPGQTRGEYVFRVPGSSLPSAQSIVVKRETNPYRGLKPYRAEHAGLFFGRAAAARRLLRHVRRHRLTVVVGPSGSGKSSLVQAGLLPRLRLRTGHQSRPDAGWRVSPPLRVTADPFTNLHAALAAAGGPPPPSAEELRGDAMAVTAWVAAWKAAHRRERLLIVVDQAEELVTRVPRSGSEAPGGLPSAAAGFLTRLGDLLSAGEGRLRVLVAVRSDYEPDIEDGPLAGFWSSGRFIVPPLTREELREVVEGPASQRALYFDDPRLLERLVDEVIGMPGGLPLLSYALSQLYLAYVEAARGDRLLTAADLAAIGGDAATSEGPVAAGGIVRILRKAADGVVEKLPDDAHRETLWRILLRMVNLVGVRPTRRQVPAWELRYPDPAENQRREEVVTRLVDEARLLVKGPDPETGRVVRAGEREEVAGGVIEPAHDELLVAWPELARRIEAARVRLPIHRRLGEAAAEWSAGGRGKRDLDLRLLGLVEASRLPQDWLNQVEDDYVTAARRERRHRTLRRWTAAVVTFLTISGAALFFRYQSHVARSRELAALAQATDHRDRGLLLAEAAYRVQPTIEARASLFSLLSILRHVEVFLHGHPPGVRSVAISSDGKLIAAGGDGGKVVIWDLTSPSRPRWLFDPPPSPNGGWNEIHALDFSGEGNDLVAAYEWGGVRIWRLSTSTGHRIAGWPRRTPNTRRVSTNWFGADPEPPERRGERPVTALALDRSGKRAVMGDFSGRLFGVDLTTSAVVWREQLFYGIDRVALVPGESTVVAADGAGRLNAIVPGSSEVLTFHAQPHSRKLVALRYLPKRKRLLSLDSNGLLVLWGRSASEFVIAEQAALPILPRTAEVDIVRGRLLVASNSGEIRSFSLETREELAREEIQGHRLTPLAIRCSETYPRCASGGLGEEVLVWNPEHVHPLLETTRQSDQLAKDLTAIGVQEDGETVTLSSSGNQLVLGEPGSRGMVSLGLTDTDPEAGSLDFFTSSPRFVAGIGRANRLLVWRREHPAKPFLDVRLHESVSALRFSPDERFLVVGDRGGSLARWDLTRTPPQAQVRQVSARPIYVLAFSSDGRQFFTSGASSPSDVGENLAEADRRIRLWDLRTLRLVRELPERHAAGLLRLDVSADSKLLVSAADDGEVVLWDTNTWRAIGSLPTTLPSRTPEGEAPTLLETVAFDRLSARVVTATDQQLWIWRIRDEDLLEKVCQIANRTIEPSEWEQSVGGSRPQTGCARREQPSR